MPSAHGAARRGIGHATSAPHGVNSLPHRSKYLCHLQPRTSAAHLAPERSLSAPSCAVSREVGHSSSSPPWLPHLERPLGALNVMCAWDRPDLVTWTAAYWPLM